MPYEEWMDDAKCAAPDVDPDIFTSTHQDEIDAAKEICRGCTAKMQCAEYALRNRERIGTWAGTDMPTLRKGARKVGVNVPRYRRTA